jgi:hypothetical protein
MFKLHAAILVAGIFVAPALTYADKPPAALGGNGVSGQITFWQDVNLLSGDPGMIWNQLTKRLGLGVESPVAKLDIFNEVEPVGVSVLSYFVGNSSKVISVKGVTYANGGDIDAYGGYFAGSSDSQVRTSYGVFGYSAPESNNNKSVGVHGEAYGDVNAIGVEGVGGDIGVLGVAPFGGVAIKAQGGKSQFSHTIEIGSADHPQGITLYDFETKTAVCLMVSSMTIELVPAKCSN